PAARDLRSRATRRPPRDEKSEAHSPLDCDAADPCHSVRMVPEAISGQAPRRCTGFPCSAPMKSRVVAPIHRRLIGSEPARRPTDQTFLTPITVAAGGFFFPGGGLK